jgi:hypothetical protein
MHIEGKALARGILTLSIASLLAPAAHAFGEPDPASVASLPGWTCSGHLAPSARGEMYVLVDSGGSEAIFKIDAHGKLDLSYGSAGTGLAFTNFLRSKATRRRCSTPPAQATAGSARDSNSARGR